MATKPAEAEIREKLARLQALKTKLDVCDAELGKLVPKVEAMLDSLRLGIPISMEIGRGDDESAQYLSFTRVGKQWRLCLEWIGHPDASGEHTTTPLSDVSRNERAQILQWHLPNLLEGAVLEMEKGVQQRREAIESTKHLVDMVTRIKGDESPLGVFSSNTIVQATSLDQVGMKVSIDMPKEQYEAIQLPPKDVKAWAKFPPRRLIISGKKREKIADSKKSDTIMDDKNVEAIADGEDE